MRSKLDVFSIEIDVFMNKYFSYAKCKEKVIKTKMRKLETMAKAASINESVHALC